MNTVNTTVETPAAAADSEVRSPDEVRLRADLARERFAAGERAGKWRNPVLVWPTLTVEVAVGDDGYVALRLQVDDYPTRAPGGRPWDLRTDAPLPSNQWPRGGPAERVFRTDWSPTNHDAPYLPCDRTGLTTHTNWAGAYPSRAWNPSRTIAFYLEEIYGELTEAHLPYPEQES